MHNVEKSQCANHNRHPLVVSEKLKQTGFTVHTILCWVSFPFNFYVKMTNRIQYTKRYVQDFESKGDLTLSFIDISLYKN